MEQGFGTRRERVLLIPPINAQRAMGPGTAVWHVGLRSSRFFSSIELGIGMVPYTVVPRW